MRFATVAVIGSGWLLSSNKILPMLGTLGRTPRSARDPLVAPAPRLLFMFYALAGPGHEWFVCG